MPGSPSKKEIGQDFLELKGQRLTLPFLAPIGQTDGAVSLATMKMKKAIGLLGIVFFSFLGALQCVSQSAAGRQEIAPHSRQAQEILKQQPPDLAIPEFPAVIRSNPHHV